MKQFQLQSQVGVLGEKLAERYLKKKGHKIVARNYYYEKGKRSGEIDIISLYRGNIHFIEVKTRQVSQTAEKSRVLYFPLTLQVTPDKMKKFAKTAEHYLKNMKQENKEYHFDVVTVLYDAEKKKAEIEHLGDVFY